MDVIYLYLIGWHEIVGHRLTNGFLRDQKVAAKSLLKIDQFKYAFL